MNTLLLFGVTLGVFLLVLVGMAIGVLFGRREISGSCGGLGSAGSKDSDQASCALCSNPSEACRELRAKKENSGASATEPDGEFSTER